jgi:hypothetical protein
MGISQPCPSKFAADNWVASHGDRGSSVREARSEKLGIAKQLGK